MNRNCEEMFSLWMWEGNPNWRETHAIRKGLKPNLQCTKCSIRASTSSTVWRNLEENTLRDGEIGRDCELNPENYCKASATSMGNDLKKCSTLSNKES